MSRMFEVLNAVQQSSLKEQIGRLSTSIEHLQLANPTDGQSLFKELERGVWRCILVDVYGLLELEKINENDLKRVIGDTPILAIGCAGRQVSAKFQQQFYTLNEVDAPTLNAFVTMMQRHNVVVQEAKAELNGLRKRLRKVNKLETLGMLTAEFSHDIKNFSFIIDYNLKSMEKLIAAGENPQSYQHKLNNIKTNTDRISHLAKQLLDYARNQSDEGPTELCLNDLLHEVAAFFAFDRERYDFALEVKTGDDKVLVKGYKLDLLRLFLNLVTNASEAIRERDSAWIQMTLEPKSEGMALVCVRDSGEGIPKVFHDRVVKPFFSTKKEGEGLGLSIAKEIAERHGGSLYIADNANTTFCVELPTLVEAP